MATNDGWNRFWLVDGWPFYVLCCVMVLALGAAAYVTTTSGGKSSSTAVAWAVGCVACPVSTCIAYWAFVQARCPNGCSNVFAGPDQPE